MWRARAVGSGRGPRRPRPVPTHRLDQIRQGLVAVPIDDRIARHLRLGVSLALYWRTRRDRLFGQKSCGCHRNGRHSALPIAQGSPRRSITTFRPFAPPFVAAPQATTTRITATPRSSPTKSRMMSASVIPPDWVSLVKRPPGYLNRSPAHPEFNRHVAGLWRSGKDFTGLTPPGSFRLVP